MVRNVCRIATIVTAVMVPTAAFAQITEKEALAQLKLLIKTELATLEDDAKARTLIFVEDLVMALFSVDAGFADELETAVGPYLADLHALADAAMRNVENGASIILANLGMNSPHFLAGSGGFLDKFSLKAEKGAFKTRKQVQKFLKKIAKLIVKSGLDVRMTSVVNPLALPVGPRPNLTAPAAPPKKLNIGAMIASSDVTVADDGTVCVGGLADPAEGDVTVTITDPAGGTSQQTVTVDGATCRWRACFTALTEGNCTVDATQAGGQSANGAIGVP